MNSDPSFLSFSTFTLIINLWLYPIKFHIDEPSKICIGVTQRIVSQWKIKLIFASFDWNLWHWPNDRWRLWLWLCRYWYRYRLFFNIVSNAIAVEPVIVVLEIFPRALTVDQNHQKTSSQTEGSANTRRNKSTVKLKLRAELHGGWLNNNLMVNGGIGNCLPSCRESCSDDALDTEETPWNSRNYLFLITCPPFYKILD